MNFRIKNATGLPYIGLDNRKETNKNKQTKIHYGVVIKMIKKSNNKI